ncbi:MAG: 50S ribosomal protein L10 [Actinomycetota bacterium]
MPKTEKVERVAELKQRIENSQALFLADFRGLTVSESGELRRSLTNAGAKFSIVKNTLMKIAAADAGAGELEPLLEGPTAVAFVEADAIGAAKSLVDAARRFRTLVLKGAWLDGRVLTAEEAQSLATIEPREVLLAKMAGLAKAEMSRAAYLFNALQSRFLSLLEAYREKLPGEAAPEPEAEPAAEAGEVAAAEAAPEGPAAAETAIEEPDANEPAVEAPGEGSTEQSEAAEPAEPAEGQQSEEEA